MLTWAAPLPHRLPWPCGRHRAGWLPVPAASRGLCSSSRVWASMLKCSFMKQQRFSLETFLLQFFFFSLESKNLWEVRYCFYCFQMITCDPLQVWIKATLITQHSFNTAESTSSHKPYLCERQQVLLHTDYHWQTWLMVYEKRERPTDHFRYILIVGTLRDYFLGLVSNNKQKVLSTPQGTERCQAP